MLLVKTMKGSRVIPKMAGIESSAKTTSEISMSRSASSSGVATQRPASRTRKWRPSMRLVAGTTRRRNLKSALFSGCGSSTWWVSRSFSPVSARKPPKT